MASYTEYLWFQTAERCEYVLITWQQIYYAEFDGRRRKRVVIKVFGDPFESA